MRFVDEVEIELVSGNGGNGCVAFCREKFRPFGGPSGGDGGKGGDITMVADDRLATLMDFRYRKRLAAKRGEHGRGKDQYGRGGPNLTVPVPVGTQVFDAEDGTLLADLHTLGQSVVIAKGGRGGRGNIHFVTSTDRAPRRADEGGEGERKLLRLELKLMADVGLLGYPNVGKSTFIARVSRARPKIADYPFTTLVPNLGVVSRDVDRNFVIADIPGLIEGAAEGAGLGHRFLKHVERTRVLLHLLTLDPDPEREPLKDFDVLLGELSRFDPELAKRSMVVAVSKIDLPDVRDYLPTIVEALESKGHKVLGFSAATGEGIEALLDVLESTLAANRAPSAPRAVPLTPPHRQAELAQTEQVEAEAEQVEAEQIRASDTPKA